MSGKLTDLAHFCDILLISLSYLKGKSNSQIFILREKFALEVRKNNLRYLRYQLSISLVNYNQLLV